jgi:aspartate racemase
MKTIGLIGGMSWESTLTYYRLINEGIREQCGGLCSGKILLYSVNFAEVDEMQSQGRWDEAAELLTGIAANLEAGGADYIMICTNTMHRVAEQVEGRISVPLLHIADATAERVIDDDIKTIGLLGTRYTMELDFYRGRLESRYGLKVLVPGIEDRTFVDDVIFKELCLGRVHGSSRLEYARIAAGLVEQGAEAVILGCTEIAMLLRPEDTEVKLYDTTMLHVEHGVRAMLS